VQVDHLDFRNRLKAAKLRAERKEWGQVSWLLQEALWIETRDRPLHTLLAKAHAELKDYSRAVLHYRIALALIPSAEEDATSLERAETLCNLAEVFLHMGDREKAHGCAQDALRLSPGHARARDLLDRSRP